MMNSNEVQKDKDIEPQQMTTLEDMNFRSLFKIQRIYINFIIILSLRKWSIMKRFERRDRHGHMTVPMSDNFPTTFFPT
jgi:hypothetical protein